MSSKLVRQARQLLISGVIVSLGLSILPVQAQQVSDTQVAALVEALRQAAGPIDPKQENLVSEWKIKPDNIPRWSRLCTGRQLTPDQFVANSTAAREILGCVMRDVLRDEYKASGNNESSAVLRSACWWMTGNPSQCGSGATRDYAQKVLGFYQKQRGNTQSQPPATPAKKPAAEPSAKPPATQSQPTPQPSPKSPDTQSQPTPQSSAQPPAQSMSSAQIADVQVSALVEALRQAAPQPDQPSDGLYSEWQVKAENIPSWSKQCNGQELTPTQFQNSPVTARAILVCVMRDVLRDQYTASSNNESVAVKRAASWWMTGDPNQYTSDSTASYTQTVLDLYQQSRLRFFSHI
ncbi:MAG TPA: hypothetical protein V6D14_19080 [Coleofasciculaceae cyanobacterium]|jgi:hypothetical protein